MSLVVAPALDVEHAIQIQRDRVRKREYEMLGRIKVIIFELAAGAPIPRNNTGGYALRFDWMGQGPFVALSQDRAELLLPTAVMHPPDIPDPCWIPAFAGEQCPKERYIRQSYANRASGKLRGTNFLIFQPVVQILFSHMRYAGFGMVNTETNPANGTKMALLIDQTKNEGHLYGGTFDIRN